MLLKELGERCPDLERARGLVARFCAMVIERTGARQFAEWVRDAQDSGLGELHGIRPRAGQGLERRHGRAHAAVEFGGGGGHRYEAQSAHAMFGRAKPDLLRKRLLHLV